MTDNTDPTNLAIAAAEVAAEPAKGASMPLVMPLTRAQQDSVQAELERQNKPKDKPKGAAKPMPVPKPKPAGTNAPDALLVDILCWPRKHDSPSELAFGKWLKALPMVQSMVNMKELSLGSWAWEVPGDGWEQVMFSCHIDTVDDFASCQSPAAKKRLVYDPHLQVITLDANHKVGSCLGADDGSGVWLMLKMIEAKVPGTYVFHRGEECGGITAKGNVRDHEDYFKRRKMAIAFDRAGNTDVINTQGGATCASVKFSEALADALNAGGSGFNYKSCANGVYTDTKDYRGIVAECINLSVGYQSQHGLSEFQDWDHLEMMLKRLIAIKWHELPVTRTPYLAPAPTTNYAGPGWKPSAREAQDDFFGGKAKERWIKGAPKTGGTTGKTSMATAGSIELDELRFVDMFDMVDNDPEETKNILLAYMRERARLLADIRLLEETIHDLK